MTTSASDPIGREHLEHAAAQSIPECLMAGFVPRRRAAQTLGAFEAGPGQIALGEKQILRAGFRIDREPACLRPSDLFDGLDSGYVYQQDGCAGYLAQTDGAMRGLPLH